MGKNLKKATKESSSPLPVVRQCANPQNSFFGSVIVATTSFAMAWALINPSNGGGWLSSDEEIPGGLGDWPLVASPDIITTDSDGS